MPCSACFRFLPMVLLPLACGAPFSPDEPPLASVRVSLDFAAELPHPLNLRAALGWLTPTAEGLRLTMQDAVLRPEARARFTGDFVVDVVGPPPSFALRRFLANERSSVGARGIDPDMVSAVAEIVLYHDGNGDRELNVSRNGEASPDQVVGRAVGVRVWYLAEGSPAPQAFRAYLPVSEGLSVRYDPTSDDPMPGACTVWDGVVPNHGHCERSSNPDGRETRAGEQLPILLAAAPRSEDECRSAADPVLGEACTLRSYTCDGFWGAGYNTSDEWPDFYAGWYRRAPEEARELCDGAACDCPGEDCEPELPPRHDSAYENGAGFEARGSGGLQNDAEATPVFCSPDGTAYVWKTCLRDASRCGQLICHYGHGDRQGATLPASWPCPNQHPTLPRSDLAGQNPSEKPPVLGEDERDLGPAHADLD